MIVSLRIWFNLQIAEYSKSIYNELNDKFLKQTFASFPPPPPINM